ncbi:MAG TPA: amidohydrolase family protein [Ramlibacter sp.]|nr:amidohydrolase family protein [Ramlibacter sp.]
MHVGRDEPILDPDIPIIDAHMHLFDRPVLGDRPPLRYMLDEYLADAQAGHRIIASVYVEIHAFARTDGPEVLRPLGEIEFANGVGAMAESGRYGNCRACAGIVGYADLRFGDQVAQLLDRAMETAPERFRGIRQCSNYSTNEAPYRFITNRSPQGVLHNPGFREGFRQLTKRGLTFDAAMFHHQLQDVADLADAFPDAMIVLNHCGHALAMDLDEEGRAEVFREWRELMLAVARRPNVHCKIGGMGLPMWGFRLEERRDPIGYLELAQIWRPWVETSIEAFGARRCMMESNYPPDGRSAGYVPLWNALKHIVRAASAEEKAALFHGTAAKVYRLQLPELGERA